MVSRVVKAVAVDHVTLPHRAVLVVPLSPDGSIRLLVLPEGGGGEGGGGGGGKGVRMMKQGRQA